jgi:hypothetical protein
LTLANTQRKSQGSFKVCRPRLKFGIPKILRSKLLSVFLQSRQLWSETEDAAVLCYELKFSRARQFSNAGYTSGVMLTVGKLFRKGMVVSAECN